MVCIAWITMAVIASIEELEAEFNLNATSIAAYSVEIGLHWIVEVNRSIAPHRECSFCVYSTNTWGLTYGGIHIRLQLTTRNDSVGMWSVCDPTALMFSSVDPLGVCNCFSRLVSLICYRRAVLRARLGK